MFVPGMAGLFGVGECCVETEEPTTEQQEEREPWQQRIFDDVFLLLAAGLVIPTLFYIVWGLWSISNVEFFAR